MNHVSSKRTFLASGIISISLIILNLIYRWPVVYYQRIAEDDGHFTTVGWLMYCCHYIPYRDIFDHKPPLVYYVISAVMHLFGPSNSYVRWGFAFLTLISVFSLYYIGLKLFRNRHVALLAAILYAFDLRLSPGGLFQEPKHWLLLSG